MGKLPDVEELVGDAKECLLVPGLGSPMHGKYAIASERLQAAARKFGMIPRQVVFDRCGQFASGVAPVGTMSMPAAAEQLVMELENLVKGSRVVCRSFGCTVMAAAACRRADLLAKLDDVVLWAPVPFHVIWQFIRDEDAYSDFRKVCLGRGLDIGDTFCRGLEPVEDLVSGLRAVRKVVIAIGSADSYVPRAFACYLRDRVEGQGKVEVRIVEGAPHEAYEAGGEIAGAFETAVLG